MNGIYEIYKLDKDGLRSSLLQKYESLDAQLNRSKNSKVSISGVCSDTVPLKMSDRIALVRNNTQLFSGVVTERQINCEDCENNIKSWEVDVEGDAVVLNWRYVFATSNNTAPGNIEVGENVYDKLPNNNDENSTQSALNRMLYYIRKHAGNNAHASRRLLTVSQADDNTRGAQGRSAYHIRQLGEVIRDIGKSDELYPQVSTNTAGTRVLTVPEDRDMTSSLVISPEFGNVASWSRSQKYPKFNACWVLSGVYEESTEGETEEEKKTTETRLWVYAEDTESVETYGRIETVITKGDIRIVASDPDTPDVVPVTEAEARKLLEAEARNQLKENAATEKWTVTMLETNSCAFMDHWRLGDKVTCVIDGVKFESSIETIKIEYSNGVEIVTPTIGDAERGLYGDLYKMINGIDKRLKTEEEK